MQYPLSYTFKLLALAPQIYVRDSSQNEIFYVKQKLFKLREDVSVFEDSSQAKQVGRIAADRISDFNANYALTDENGTQLGSVGRKGMRSLFKAEYQILDHDGIHALTLREDSMMVRILDGLIGGIPIIGFLLAMLINPSYTVADLRVTVQVTTTREHTPGGVDPIL